MRLFMSLPLLPSPPSDHLSPPRCSFSLRSSGGGGGAGRSGGVGVRAVLGALAGHRGGAAAGRPAGLPRGKVRRELPARAPLSFSVGLHLTFMRMCIYTVLLLGVVKEPPSGGPQDVDPVVPKIFSVVLGNHSRRFPVVLAGLVYVCIFVIVSGFVFGARAGPTKS